MRAGVQMSDRPTDRSGSIGRSSVRSSVRPSVGTRRASDVDARRRQCASPRVFVERRIHRRRSHKFVVDDVHRPRVHTVRRRRRRRRHNTHARTHARARARHESVQPQNRRWGACRAFVVRSPSSSRAFVVHRPPSSSHLVVVTRRRHTSSSSSAAPMTRIRSRRANDRWAMGGPCAPHTRVSRTRRTDSVIA